MGLWDVKVLGRFIWILCVYESEEGVGMKIILCGMMWWYYISYLWWVCVF